MARLLGQGQRVDETDTFGMTALRRAIQGNQLEMVALLLKRGADVQHTADTYTFGSRALHVAAKYGASRQVIERLIHAGAEMDLAANSGTPMQMAQRHGNEATVQILRDLEAEVQAQDRSDGN